MSLLEDVKGLDYVSTSEGTIYGQIGGTGVVTGGLDYVWTMDGSLFYAVESAGGGGGGGGTITRTFPGWKDERTFPPVSAERTFPI